MSILIEARDALTKATYAALAFHDVDWRAADVAPETFEALCAHYHETGEFLVWNGASDATIYASPRDNWAARAWHDFHHVTGSNDFTLEGERAACEAQGGDLEILRAKGELSEREAMLAWQLLQLEVIGQALTQFAEHGEFPADQRAWTEAKLRNWTGEKV